MGLLDALNSDDARLGIGLLAAGGYSPTPMSFGQRVQMAMQGMDAQKQNQLKNKLLESQVAENASQADMRKQQLAMSMRQMDMQNQLLGIGQPQGQASGMPAPSGMQTMPQTGAPQQPEQIGNAVPGAMPSQPMGQGAGYVQPQNSQAGTLDALSKQYGIPAEALKFDLVFNGGKGIAEMVSKRGTPNMQVSNGYAYDANRIGPGYLPQLNMSQDGKTSMVRIGPDGLPVVSAPQGALDTFGSYQRAQAGFKPIKVFNPATQREEFSNEAAVAQPGGEAGMRTAVQGGMGADPMAIQREIQQTTADLAKVTDPSSKAQLQAYLADLQSQAQRVPTGNVAAGPSAQEKLANEAGGEVNKTWLKTSYEPVIASIGPTDDMLASVRVARNAITQMGGTGWGTETKAAAANVLNGLGLSTSNSKMLASSSQVFQNAAMERLQSVLNAAKGPQTEGDATRAMKTFAQLGNTTEANNFILDLAEAKAQREKMKANFYQQALPIAQKKGDLAEIDREWSKRQPSIFSLPGMAKWGVK